MTTPPLPPGFVLEQQAPPLPPGFQLESADIPTLPTVEAERPDPTEGMGLYEQYLAGLGRSMVTGYEGVKQLGTSVIGELAGDRTGITDGDNPVTRWADRTGAELQAKEAERRRLDEPLMNRPAGRWGDMVGTALQLIGPGLALRGSAVGRTLMPTTIRGNAAQGAAFGALQPTAGEGERTTNVGLGGALGGLGAAVPQGLGALARLTRGSVPTLAGAERKAGETILAESSGLASLMRPQPSAVPGVQRTLAEETLDPGIARLERQMRGQTNIFQPIDTANNAARVQALEGVAGTPQAMDAAYAARAQAANPLRRDAMQIEGVDTSRLLSQIGRLAKSQDGRPAVQSALQQVRSLLTREVPDAERMKSAIKPLQEFIDADRTSATNREAAKAAIAQIKSGEWPSATFTTGGPGTRGVGQSYDTARSALAQSRKALERTTAGHDRVAVLDNVRKTIGDMLSGKYGGDSAASLAGSRELLAVRNQLDRVLERQAPSYGQYLDAFRSGSKPINRMQTGQQLLASDSGGAVLDPQTGVQVLTPASFSKKARNLDAVAAKATGFKKAKAADILAPDDLKVIRSIQDDLERQSFRATAGSGGNSMTQERQALQERMGRRLASRLPIVGGFVEALDQLGSQRVNERLAYLMANPNEARRVLAALNKDERKVLNKALFQLSARGSTVAVPALAE